MDKRLLISADSHVVEPPEVFAGLADRFGEERAPAIVNSEDQGPRVYLGNGRFGNSVGAMLSAGMVGDPDLREKLKKGYEIRPGSCDPRQHVVDMDTDGLTAEVLFPSLLFGMFGQSDHEVAQATFARYNDWLADFCSEAPGRLFPVACTQVDDVDSAIELMEAGKKRGHVGVCVPYVPEVPYSDSRYDKLWAAAQDMQFPITFHAGCRGGGPTDPAFGRRSNSTWYTLISTGMAVTISELILSRVCERFPRLMFVPTEFETGWLAHFLQKTDWITHRGGSKLPMKPSDYWKRNFRCTFEDDELGIRTRDIIGTKTMMWANDYPHGDAIWPNSQEVLDRVLAECGPEECAAMLAGNAIELYHLPIAA